MPAFWLTYKPLSSAAPRGWPPEQMDRLVSNFQADSNGATPLWRIASSKAASVGDRVYLFQQGSGPRGVFGIGKLIEAPRRQPDPTDIDAGVTERARIRLMHLVNPRSGFLLDYDAIADIIPQSLLDAQQSGNRVPEEVSRELENRLAPIAGSARPLGAHDADAYEFDPSSVNDARERALRAIRIRRGQPAFREALMSAYRGKCAITGCAVEHVLEAAHIYPYAGRTTNHPSNGLLLRADLHTLFDCYLIAIEPTTREVVVAEELRSSPYMKLAGRRLRTPRDVASTASRRSLEMRYAAFKAKARLS